MNYRGEGNSVYRLGEKITIQATSRYLDEEPCGGCSAQLRRGFARGSVNKKGMAVEIRVVETADGEALERVNSCDSMSTALFFANSHL